MADSLVWKRRLGRVYSSLHRLRGDKVPAGIVLTYHSVGPSRLGLPQSNFREQMQWLRDNASVVSLRQLLAGEWPSSPSGITCAVTFDDGYASVFRHAFPVLSETRLPATVYLVGDAIGDASAKSSSEFGGLYPGEEMLVWSEVREMQAHGISFGSHLLRHKDLTTLAASEADGELRGSKQLIEDRTGSECLDFCYPWGKHDGRAVAAVKAAGYVNAVIAIQGRWRKNELPDMYRVPRADVRRDYSLNDFAAVVAGDWDYLKYIQRFRRLLD